MMRPQQAKQVFQIVGPRDRLPLLNQERLQEFLRGLLTAKTNEVIFRRPASGELLGHAVVALGLADPLARQPFHTERGPGP